MSNSENERYRLAARRLYEDVGRVESEYIKIPEHAAVHPAGGKTPEGAFVEAVIWIPVARVTP